MVFALAFLIYVALTDPESLACGILLYPTCRRSLSGAEMSACIPIAALLRQMNH